ncbi:MAG: FtsH protease activity modulator HflK [Pseudomonadota bacterium]
MAWNEPGGGKRDPWSGGNGNQGPPDLDEVVRKLQKKFGGIFGGRRGGGPSGGSPAGGGRGGLGIGVVVAVLVLIWLASGIYIIEPAERGVVLRFGAFANITEPGPHWHIPFPVEQVVKVNVDEISTFRHKAQMLTRDENIVDIELTVQSRIQDPADFLFQDMSPQKTMRDATETAVREVIGKSDLDFILTEGRGSVAAQVRDMTQTLVDQYTTGMAITNVNMLPAKPPEQVKGAFDDAIKAREDKERIENEAEAYSNEVVPVARGAAAREIEDAKAYKARKVSEAKGESDRFLAVLAEYELAPEVTRQRLYLETVEAVYSNTTKVLLDVQGSNNLTYLPLDRLIKNSPPRVQSPVSPPLSAPADRQPQAPQRPERSADRNRRIR